MSSPSHADIIDKLQKLRVLAFNKAAMPGEVEAALRAMSALMARYRITEAELEAARHEPTRLYETDDLWPPAKRIPNWRLVMLNAIGRPNGVVVHVVTYENKMQSVRLAGDEKDVEIARSLWSWLEAEAIRLAWGPLARLPHDMRPKRAKRLSKFQTDWIIGFAMGVAQQLELELQKNAPPAPDKRASAAIVLIDQRTEETKTWLARLPDTKPVYNLKDKEFDSLALERGFDAGERYHLGKKLPKGESP